jgi:lysozyme
MKHPIRNSIAALGVSAAALIGIAQWEGYRDQAYIPVPGDVPTIGWGTTDGVRMGDSIDPTRALVRLHADAEAHAQRLAECIGDVPLYLHEWDAYVSWSYNVGTGAACRSTLVRKLRAHPPDYAGACTELLRWVYAGGQRLRGLVNRREAEYRLCMGEVSQ